MISVPYTDLHRQYLDCRESIDQAISSTISHSGFIGGKDLADFETEFAALTGSPSCAATASGTTSLICAIRAMGLGPGDEIITTAHSFVSTAEAIVMAGAIPVFVDIDPRTYLIDLDQVLQRITPRSRALLFVDLYGQCPNLTRVREICDAHNLVMIEDAAQSVGNVWQGRSVGSISDVTCFSFNPGKNLGAMGDAGCVTGSITAMHRVRMLRDHGRQGRSDFHELGYNARMDTLQANIIRAKMPIFQSWIQRKREIAAYYSDRLQHHCDTPITEPGNSHSYYAYVIAVPQRDRLREYLAQQGIATNVHYPMSLNCMRPFQQWYHACPRAEHVVNHIVSLPCYHSLTDDQIEHVIRCVISNL